MAQYILTAAQKASVDAVLAASVPVTAVGTITGLTNGTSYYGLAVDYSPVFTPQADLSYAQRFVDTNDTASLSATPGGTATCVSFSVWFRRLPGGTSTSPSFVRTAQGFELSITSAGALRLDVSNSTGTAIYSAQSASSLIADNTLYHVFASYDGNTGAAVVRLNGTLISMTATTGPLTGALRPNRLHSIVSSGAARFNAEVSDLWLEYGSAVRGFDLFFNDGTPPDLTGVGSPQVWLGGGMRADDRDGNAAQGWNDGFNLGSAAITVVSGTFTDVP